MKKKNSSIVKIMAYRIHLCSLLWWFFVFIMVLWTLQCRSWAYTHIVYIAIYNIIRIYRLCLPLAFHFTCSWLLWELWIGDCYVYCHWQRAVNRCRGSNWYMCCWQNVFHTCIYTRTHRDREREKYAWKGR